MPTRQLELTMNKLDVAQSGESHNRAMRIQRMVAVESSQMSVNTAIHEPTLEPVQKTRLIDLLASWQPLDEGLPEVDHAPPQIRTGKTGHPT